MSTERAIVEVAVENVGSWGFSICLNQDAYDWLCQYVGQGDRRFWYDEDSVNNHMDHADGPEICRECRSDGSPCSGDVWGWYVANFKAHRLAFVFNDPKSALLFKLTWGGA